jgi:hypothetical protein
MSITSLSDAAILARAMELAARGRITTVELLALLIEVDDRRLYAAGGHPSLYPYCVDAHQLSDGDAATLSPAARAARRFPLVLDLLRGGGINLTTVRLLAPHLTEENHRQVLEAACGLARPQVEHLVVTLAPRPVPAPVLRPVMAAPPPTFPAPVAVSRPQVASVTPLAAEVYRLGVNLSPTARAAWMRLRELVAGDDGQVMERALSAAVATLEKEKLGLGAKPGPARPTAENSRHVPADVKRTVTARDGGQCGFRSTDGRRCKERRHLQFHHVRPWMAGGPTTAANVELRCGTHNRYESDLFYGRKAMPLADASL